MISLPLPYQDIIATSARPDLVIAREKEMMLIRGLQSHTIHRKHCNANKRKRAKENFLLVLREFNRKLLGITLEIGFLGHSC